MSTIQTILVTADIGRLQNFYTQLFGAEFVSRVPEDGDIFYLGLRVGDSDLGMVHNAEAPVDTPQRMLVSIEVDDVDALLSRVEKLGGEVRSPANDMPWGQRVGHIKDPDGNAVNVTQPVRTT